MWFTDGNKGSGTITQPCVASSQDYIDIHNDIVLAEYC